MTQAELSVEGFVNFDTVRDWLHAVEHRMDRPSITIDFTAMKGFNSAVLAWMVAVKRLGHQRGVEIIWQAVPAPLCQLARVYNLLTLLGLSGHE